MIMELNSIPGYNAATFSHSLRNKPSDSFLQEHAHNNAKPHSNHKPHPLYSHDVGLVYCSHFLPIVPHGIVEGVFGNPVTVLPSYYLETLHYTRYSLKDRGVVSHTYWVSHPPHVPAHCILLQCSL